MIITRTPFRMSFFGGGTDMPEFFNEHGGSVISTTFDKYCYVTARHLPRFFDYSTELVYSKLERVSDPSELEHPAVRNAMQMLDTTWRLKRGTGLQVSTGSIDALYERGLKAGALGGKLLGAGGGGFLVFYVEPDAQESVRRAMSDLLYIPFEFEDGGTSVVYYNPEDYDLEGSR